MDPQGIIPEIVFGLKHATHTERERERVRKRETERENIHTQSRPIPTSFVPGIKCQKVLI